jgi:hypothetical protein
MKTRYQHDGCKCCCYASRWASGASDNFSTILQDGQISMDMHYVRTARTCMAVWEESILICLTKLKLIMLRSYKLQREFWEQIWSVVVKVGGMRWHSGWGTALQTRRFAGSIPGSVIGIIHWNNPSGHTMDLGSTQPLTEMSTRNISCG